MAKGINIIVKYRDVNNNLGGADITYLESVINARFSSVLNILLCGRKYSITIADSKKDNVTEDGLQIGIVVSKNEESAIKIMSQSHDDLNEETIYRILVSYFPKFEITPSDHPDEVKNLWKNVVVASCGNGYSIDNSVERADTAVRKYISRYFTISQ